MIELGAVTPREQPSSPVQGSQGRQRRQRGERGVSMVWVVVWLCLLVLCIAFGIHVLVLHNEGTVYPDGDCGALPGNPVTATKVLLSQWNWRYDISDGGAKIQQVCPSLTHDVNVYGTDGRLVSRSDGKIATVLSKTYVNDCHGDRLWTVRTGSLFQTVINGHKLWVSLEVRNTTDDVVAFVDGRHFFTDNVDIREAREGRIVANLNRNKWKLSRWRWTINQVDPTHPASDLRLLATLAGKTSFSELDNSTDLCNQYFFAASIAVIVGLVVVFAAAVGFILTEIAELNT